MGRLSFCHSFRGIFLWEGWKLLLNDGNLTLTKERSHRRKWFGLVFHIRGGGIGGGTVGLAPFDDENFEGPSKILIVLESTVQKYSWLFSCPHQLIWASAALAHWYIKSAHSRVNAVFFVMSWLRIESMSVMLAQNAALAVHYCRICFNFFMYVVCLYTMTGISWFSPKTMRHFCLLNQ